MNPEPVSATAAQIEAAEAYEKLFVPALFGGWARRTVAAAGVALDDRVLDVACGTGVVARKALARVGGDGFVAGLDANPGMVEVARRLSPRIEYSVGDAAALPFPNGAFGAVLCQFGLMFFVDKPAALREMNRVLRPGGHFAVVVWDEIETAPAFAALAASLDRFMRSKAAGALHAPFALGDRQRLRTLFTDAGVSPVTIATVQGSARFPSVRVLVEAEVRGWLLVMGVEPTDDQVAQVLEDMEAKLRGMVQHDGTVTFEMSAHIVTDES
jgi:ubiquinone/menaquinone biosynthesis C-methylase UbiE